MTNRILSQLSSDTLAIIGLLETMEIGEVCPYTKISEHLRLPEHDMARLRSPLRQARTVLQQSQKKMFDCVKGHGIQRLSNEQTAGTMPKRIHAVHRAALRGRKVAACVDVTILPADKRASFVGSASLVVLLGEISTATATKKLAIAAESQSSPLAAEQCWRALRGNK